MAALELLPGGAPPIAPKALVLTEVAKYLREQALRLPGSDEWRPALIDIALMAEESADLD